MRSGQSLGKHRETEELGIREDFLEEGPPQWRLEGLLECTRCIPREQERLLCAEKQQVHMFPGNPSMWLSPPEQDRQAAWDSAQWRLFEEAAPRFAPASARLMTDRRVPVVGALQAKCGPAWDGSLTLYFQGH